MTLKLAMDHLGLQIYKVYINDEPGLALIYFTARSNLVKIAYYVYTRFRCQMMFTGRLSDVSVRFR